MFTIRLRRIFLAGLLFGVLLAACAPRASASFPTGRFVRSDNKNHGLIFNSDGTFSVLDSGTTIVNGKYSIKGDTYTDESNDQNCPVMSFKYTFDGSKLAFNYVGKPADDPCDGRRGDFNNQTYELALGEGQHQEPGAGAITKPRVADAIPVPGRSEEVGGSEQDSWLGHMLREDEKYAREDAAHAKAICAELTNIVERTYCWQSR